MNDFKFYEKEYCNHSQCMQFNHRGLFYIICIVLEINLIEYNLGFPICVYYNNHDLFILHAYNN